MHIGYGQIGSTLDITVSDNGQRKPAVVTEFIPVTPETYTLLPAPGYAIRSVCLSFCLCAASYKKIMHHAWIYLKFYRRAIHSQDDFILEMIRVELHCHLWVTVARQSYFGVKSTVAEIRPKLP